jgi:putative transcriptional regulator
MTISNKIKLFRTERGVTQEALAASIGVSRQTIIAMEKGNYTPSLGLALVLSKYFNVSVEKLFELQ